MVLIKIKHFKIYFIILYYTVESWIIYVAFTAINRLVYKY